MNLRSAGVFSGAVGKFIQDVSLLLGKSVDRVTLRQQKVDVGKKHMVPLVGESDMTLYTNETSKGREPTRPDNPSPPPPYPGF